MGAYPAETVRKRWLENVFGKELKSGKAWSLFVGRLALGFLFLWSAYGKILTEMSGKMATSGFLSGTSVASGPFAGFFNSISGNWVVEYLVVYGELLIAISILFGIFTRVGSVAGMLMMLLFTIAMWPIADTAGANPIVDIRVIYGVMLLGFFFLRPGRFLGGDAILHNSEFVNNRPTLKKILSYLG